MLMEKFYALFADSMSKLTGMYVRTAAKYFN